MKTVGISLQPWSGKFFSRFPLHQLTMQIVGGEELDRDLLYEYWNRFAEAADDQEIMALAEKMVESKLGSFTANAAVESIIKDIQQQTSEDLSVIFDRVPYSTRRIEQLFMEEVGISAKFYRKKVRFQNALKGLKLKLYPSLTDLAYATGYYDQAKFIKDFRSFTGDSPGKYLAAQGNVGGELV